VQKENAPEGGEAISRNGSHLKNKFEYGKQHFLHHVPNLMALHKMTKCFQDRGADYEKPIGQMQLC